LSREASEERHIKRMADLLRRGSTLTDLACPACSSPLFRLKNGDLWCAKCEKKVVVVKDEEETSKIESSIVLDTLEATLVEKMQEIQKKIQQAESPEELQKLSSTLSEMLESLEKIRKAKRP